MLYPSNGILLSKEQKRNKLFIEATAWMSLKIIMVNERSRAQKSTYYDSIFIELYKMQTNL